MEHVTQNLTEGKLARQIFLFSVPLMISNLLQALFNMADIGAGSTGFRRLDDDFGDAVYRLSDWHG